MRRHKRDDGRTESVYVEKEVTMPIEPLVSGFDMNLLLLGERPDLECLGVSLAEFAGSVRSPTIWNPAGESEASEELRASWWDEEQLMVRSLRLWILQTSARPEDTLACFEDLSSPLGAGEEQWIVVAIERRVGLKQTFAALKRMQDVSLYQRRVHGAKPDGAEPHDVIVAPRYHRVLLTEWFSLDERDPRYGVPEVRLGVKKLDVASVLALLSVLPTAFRHSRGTMSDFIQPA